YQPWAGRWLSADPAGTVDGLNLFRMVQNNPTTLNDLDGLSPGLGDFFNSVRKSFKSKEKSKTSNRDNIELAYTPAKNSRRGQIEKQYQDAKASGVNNWLKAYQRQVRTNLLTPVAVSPNNILSNEQNNTSAMNIQNAPGTSTSTNESANNFHHEDQDDEKYIKNIGSESLSINEMKTHYRNGVISYFNISITDKSADEKISQLINEHKTYKKHNEYLFALSESAGLRIMERGRAYSGVNEIVFHHNNIFLTRKDIISVGTLFVEDNKISITNFSGHYRPSAESLSHIYDFLLNKGVQRRKIEISSYKFNS
ncbi:RHS repeat-associated core domain-containing protein, partial [Enterobacter kobei]